MRILYFHQYFSTRDGAAITRSYEMALRLIQSGHSVKMICGSYNVGSTGLSGPFVGGRREGLVDGIHVVEFDLPYANADSFARRVYTFLRYATASIGIALREPADLLFATSTPLTAALPGIVARWIGRRTFVFEVRDLWPELPRAMGVIKNPVVLWAMGVLEWAAYRSAHRLIGLSPGIVEGIARRSVATERIAMIPNGCDTDLFGKPPNEPRISAIKPDDFLAVFAGTHGPANGLSAVIDAASVLKRRGRENIKIALIGDGKLKPSLIERATAEGLDNVVFLDSQPKKVLASFLASADLGLQILLNVPEFYNGTSPNKFFDYLASGLPVLVNYPGWVADIIDRHQIGYVVNPDAPEELADALEKAALEGDKRQSMSRRARELASTEFSRDRLGSFFVRWLEEASLAPRPPGGDHVGYPPAASTRSAASGLD